MIMGAGIAQSVQRPATYWTIRVSNPGGSARFSAPVQTGPGARPDSYTMGTGSFSGVKRSGRGVDRLPQSSAKVKERVELYLYSPSGPSWPVIGWLLSLPITWLHSSVKIRRKHFISVFGTLKHGGANRIHRSLKIKNSTYSGLPFLTIFIFLAQRLPNRTSSTENGWGTPGWFVIRKTARQSVYCDLSHMRTDVCIAVRRKRRRLITDPNISLHTSPGRSLD